MRTINPAICLQIKANLHHSYGFTMKYFHKLYFNNSTNSTLLIDFDHYFICSYMTQMTNMKPFGSLQGMTIWWPLSVYFGTAYVHFGVDIHRSYDCNGKPIFRTVCGLVAQWWLIH